MTDVEKILMSEINQRQKQIDKLNTEIEGLDKALKVIGNNGTEPMEETVRGVIPKQVTFEPVKSMEERFTVPKPPKNYRITKMWNRSELIKLRNMADSGSKISDIARAIKRSENAILVKLYTKYRRKYTRVGNSVRPVGSKKQKRKEWSNQENQMLSGMFVNGFSIPQIAERLRRTRSSVENRSRRLGLKH